MTDQDKLDIVYALEDRIEWLMLKANQTQIDRDNIPQLILILKQLDKLWNLTN
jgi:hypothetical protein